jgi:NADH-quinone oxidoreductase subunit C
MDKVQLAGFVTGLAPYATVIQGKEFVEVTVAPEKLHSMAMELKNNKDTACDFLSCLTGMDWKTELGVIYHLRSTIHGHTIVVKVRIADRENPAVDSLCDVWPGAEFHEREAYDLLGIRFNGHPDLRRLFLDSSWGYPLRKDYKDDINIVSK